MLNERKNPGPENPTVPKPIERDFAPNHIEWVDSRSAESLTVPKDRFSERETKDV